MIGTIVGLLSGKDHNSWEETIKYGIGVSFLYMIVAVILAFLGMLGTTFSATIATNSMLSAFSGMFTGIWLIILIPLALIAGVLETIVGHGIWIVIEMTKDALKGF